MNRKTRRIHEVCHCRRRDATACDSEPSSNGLRSPPIDQPASKKSLENVRSALVNGSMNDRRLASNCNGIE